MTARYRVGSFLIRYARRRRRWPTSLRRPRREWLSLGKLARCRFRSRIRSVRSAIWTSGEPVSPSLVAYPVMISVFASRASGTRSSEHDCLTDLSFYDRRMVAARPSTRQMAPNGPLGLERHPRRYLERDRRQGQAAVPAHDRAG